MTSGFRASLQHNRRTKQQSTKPPPPATTPAPTPAATSRPVKPPKAPGPMLTYLCGHAEKVAQAERYPCPVCANKARRERNERKRMKNKKDRLPDGATFEAVYDASLTRWLVVLKVPRSGGEPATFTDEGSALFPTLERLDQAFRAQQQARPAEVAAK